MAQKSGHTLHNQKPIACLPGISAWFIYMQIAWIRTSTGFGKFRQSQNSIIAGDRLECDVTMPGFFAALLLLVFIKEAEFVQLFGLLRANHTDLVILVAIFAARVADWVDMQTRRTGLTRKLTKALDELLL